MFCSVASCRQAAIDQLGLNADQMAVRAFACIAMCLLLLRSHLCVSSPPAQQHMWNLLDLPDSKEEDDRQRTETLAMRMEWATRSVSQQCNSVTGLVPLACADRGARSAHVCRVCGSAVVCRLPWRCVRAG